MRKHRPLLLLTILAVSTASSLFVRGVKAASENSCVTAQCHAALLKAKVVHEAARSCDDCHEAAATPHPQKGLRTFRLAQEGSELCKMCHTIKADEKYMHGPAAVGDCTSCHDPHASDNKALLVKKGNDLCFTCHGAVQDETKKKVVHDALQEGCTSCHNPHGSSFKKLLAEEGDKLCYQCHSKIGERIEKSKSVHAPVKAEKACASCHDPHASDGEKLLQKPEKDLCLDCHKNILKKNQTVLHGPIQQGKCTPCHDPHGAPNANLLVKAFPSDLYVPYSDNAYSLCFSCHNRDLLRFPDTSFATGFRDGERNLHFLHVNKKEKGRNCKACHAMHGSELPKLIPDKVLFGKWDLPLKYTKTETGGSCAPGCHKPYNYDRKTPGKAPDPEKPKGAAKPKGK